MVSNAGICELAPITDSEFFLFNSHHLSVEAVLIPWLFRSYGRALGQTPEHQSSWHILMLQICCQADDQTGSWRQNHRRIFPRRIFGHPNGQRLRCQQSWDACPDTQCWYECNQITVRVRVTLLILRISS